MLHGFRKLRTLRNAYLLGRLTEVGGSVKRGWWVGKAEVKGKKKFR